MSATILPFKPDSELLEEVVSAFGDIHNALNDAERALDYLADQHVRKPDIAKYRRMISEIRTAISPLSNPRNG